MQGKIIVGKDRYACGGMSTQDKLYIRNLTLRKMFQPFSVLSFYADFHRKIG